MKKIAKWLAVTSMIVFVFAWGLMGLKLLENDYRIEKANLVDGIAIIREANV